MNDGGEPVLTGHPADEGSTVEDPVTDEDSADDEPTPPGSDLRLPAGGSTVDGELVARVERVLRSGMAVDGPMTAQFETATADSLGVDHAITVASARTGLSVALRAAGVSPGDEVFVPAYGPWATVSAVLELGATPVFVDANPATYTMRAFGLERAISAATSPAAVVPVHVHGQPAELHRIAGLARQHDLTLLEDARGALGARYQGDPLGTVGDLGCFSLDPSGPVTAGGGGVVVTDDDALAETARSLRDGHAMSGFSGGVDCRLDELSAAVGHGHLAQLPDRIERRRAIAQRYRERLGAIPRLRLPADRRDVTYAYTTFPVHVPAPGDLAATLADLDVPTDRPYATPAHRHPAVGAHLQDVPGTCHADRLSDRLLALPLGVGLSATDVDRICGAVEAHDGLADRQ